MPRVSSLDALGANGQIHVLDLELHENALGGASSNDHFDSDRVREAGNLLKRVCTKQSIAGGYSVTALREGDIRVRCGFANRHDRDIIANFAGAASQSAGPWASCRRFVLDPETVEALIAVAIPRDIKGPGRRARERQRDEEGQRGLRWKVRGG